MNLHVVSSYRKFENYLKGSQHTIFFHFLDLLRDAAVCEPPCTSTDPASDCYTLAGTDILCPSYEQNVCKVSTLYIVLSLQKPINVYYYR